jgi:hypothetical protein
MRHVWCSPKHGFGSTFDAFTGSLYYATQDGTLLRYLGLSIARNSWLMTLLNKDTQGGRGWSVSFAGGDLFVSAEIVCGSAPQASAFLLLL